MRILLLLFVLCLSVSIQANESSFDISIVRGDQSSLLQPDQLSSLPQHSFTSEVPWLEGEHTFSGPSLKDTVDALGLTLNGLTITAVDDYFIEPSKKDIAMYDPILVTHINGKAISEFSQAPLWLMWPFGDYKELRKDEYYFQAIWQIVRIESN